MKIYFFKLQRSPRSLSDPACDWNYLWTGRNRSFDYEPDFALKNMINKKINKFSS